MVTKLLGVLTTDTLPYQTPIFVASNHSIIFSPAQSYLIMFNPAHRSYSIIFNSILFHLINHFQLFNHFQSSTILFNHFQFCPIIPSHTAVKLTPLYGIFLFNHMFQWLCKKCTVNLMLND